MDKIDRLTRSIERKTNQIHQQRVLKPTTNKERQYRTSLVIFDTLMKFESDAQVKGLTGQDKARLADDMANKAAREIRKIWR